MEELIIGEWYKLSSGSVVLPHEIWYMKFSGIDENNKVLCSEYIENTNHRFANEHFGSKEQYNYTLIDVSKILDFLPVKHPDRIKIKVEPIIEDLTPLANLLKNIK
jgi:hypothetical protein